MLRWPERRVWLTLLALLVGTHAAIQSDRSVISSLSQRRKRFTIYCVVREPLAVGPRRAAAPSPILCRLLLPNKQDGAASLARRSAPRAQGEHHGAPRRARLRGSRTADTAAARVVYPPGATAAPAAPADGFSAEFWSFPVGTACTRKPGKRGTRPRPNAGPVLHSANALLNPLPRRLKLNQQSEFDGVSSYYACKTHGII